MSDAQPIRRQGMTLGTKRRLSPDELAAEESRIIQENFPNHRSLHLKPNDGAPRTGKEERVDIVVTEEVLLATAHHVAQDTSKESGGFLLGNRYECPNTHREYIIVDQFMKADYTEGTQVSLTFTTESWAQLKDRLDGKYRGKALVGWYHSHPGMGIFLSNYDVDIHKNRFANEWDVALVLDPVKHEGGFFAWIDGNVNPREKVDFYELLDGDSRETVVAWTNYTAEDPKTGVAAALKAVNTQNSDGNPLTAVSASQKAQTATATGGLFGNPFLIVGGAAILALLLLGTVFAGYWIFFRGSDKADSNRNTENPTVNNKVLNAEKIKVKRELEGHVSGNNKLIVDLQIADIGETAVIKEILKGDNLQIVINGKQAKITESSIANAVLLKVRAETELSAEEIEAFNNENQQNFAMSVDISYNGDFVSRKVETKFKKGKGNTSLGDLVAFSDDFSETNDTTRKVNPKPVVSEKQNESQQSDNDKQQQQTQKQTTTTSTRNNRESTTQTTTTTNPNRKEKGKGIKDDVTDAVTNPKNTINNGIRKGKKGTGIQ